MIKVTCECGRKISASDKFLNKRVKCPQCGRPVLIAPAPSNVEASTAASDVPTIVTAPATAKLVVPATPVAPKPPVAPGIAGRTDTGSCRAVAKIFGACESGGGKARHSKGNPGCSG